MYAHCEMGGGCCCFNASRVWPCRWFQLLPVTWWMREEKENYHLILDSLLAGIVIYSFSSYTSPIFPFSFFKIFVFERFREMSRKMFGGFDLALSHRLPKSVHGILPFVLSRPAILFCFSFRFIFLAYGGVSSNQHHTHSSFFFGGQMGVNEWANLWMNESSSRIYFQKYQCSFHRSLWFLVGHFLNLFGHFVIERPFHQSKNKLFQFFLLFEIWNF